MKGFPEFIQKRLAVLFLMTCFLGSCFIGTAAAKTDVPKTIVIAVPGGPGSPMYIVSAGFAKMIEKYMNVPTALTTTGGMDGVVLATRGEVHFVFMSTPVGIPVITGTGPIKNFGPQKVRAFIQGIPLEWELVTLNRSGITSFTDLKGKTVLAYPRAAQFPVGTLFDALLEAHDMKVADLQAVRPWDTVTEAVDALKSGSVDAIIYPGTHPTAGLRDLASSRSIRIVGIDDTAMARVSKSLPWVTKIVIPGGTYKGMDEDINVPGYLLMMVCQKDLPDQFVQSAARMVFENSTEFHSFGPPCRYFNLAGVENITTVPYHPGAIQYYKEAGAWSPKMDQLQEELIGCIPDKFK